MDKFSKKNLSTANLRILLSKTESCVSPVGNSCSFIWKKYFYSLTFHCSCIKVLSLDEVYYLRKSNRLIINIRNTVFLLIIIKNEQKPNESRNNELVYCNGV